MTAADRRLAALAALFAPGSAVALLARLGGAGRADPVGYAARLAAAPRRDRLAALSAAVAIDPDVAHARAEAVATAERPRVAALLRTLAAGGGADAGVSPALIRLCRERIGR